MKLCEILLTHISWLICVRITEIKLNIYPTIFFFSVLHFFYSTYNPSIEYLSLTECSFDQFECHVSSSSLMSLEVKYCRQLQVVQVHEAKNLESFTFVSPPSPNSKCKMVILNKYLSNLKNININVDDLGEGMPPCSRGHNQYPKSRFF